MKQSRFTAGAVVYRAGKAKYIGRWGTTAVVIGVFATSYTATASVRCAIAPD